MRRLSAVRCPLRAGVRIEHVLLLNGCKDADIHHNKVPGFPPFAIVAPGGCADLWCSMRTAQGTCHVPVSMLQLQFTCRCWAWRGSQPRRSS